MGSWNVWWINLMIMVICILLVVWLRRYCCKFVIVIWNKLKSIKFNFIVVRVRVLFWIIIWFSSSWVNRGVISLNIWIIREVINIFNRICLWGLINLKNC